MFAGHVGAALALGRAVPRLNLGGLVLAAMLLDVVLWALVLLGLETATIAADFGSTHQPHFEFPYSHSLLAGAGWSMLGAATAYMACRRPGPARLRAAAVVAAAVFSHWLLDALVHEPEMPVAGSGSGMLGLGLWRQMPVALAVEAIIALTGLCVWVSGAGVSRARKLGLSALVLLVVAFTVVGMTVAPPPPSATAMAAASLATIVLVSLLAGWLGYDEDRKEPDDA